MVLLKICKGLLFTPLFICWALSIFYSSILLLSTQILSFDCSEKQKEVHQLIHFVLWNWCTGWIDNPTAEHNGVYKRFCIGYIGLELIIWSFENYIIHYFQVLMKIWMKIASYQKKKDSISLGISKTKIIWNE